MLPEDGHIAKLRISDPLQIKQQSSYQGVQWMTSAGMEAKAAEVLEPKKVLFLGDRVKTIGYKDVDLVKDICHGLNITRESHRMF